MGKTALIENTEEADLTLEELAFLFSAADSEPARMALAKLTRFEPVACQYRRLEQIAAEAGLSTHVQGWELDAVQLEKVLGELLEADDWQAQADVFRSGGEERGVAARELFRLCEARAARGGRHAGRLGEIAERLRGYAEAEEERIAREEDAEIRLKEALADLLRSRSGRGRLLFLRDLLDRGQEGIDDILRAEHETSEAPFT